VWCFIYVCDSLGDLFSFLGFKVTVLHVEFLGDCVLAVFFFLKFIPNLGVIHHTVCRKEGSRDSFGTPYPHTREL